MSTPTYGFYSRLSLRANFSWTIAGNVVYAGCQWGMLVVLAKLGPPEMVGQLALGLAITAPVIMFANLELRAIQATDARHEYRFGDYLGLRLITMALALLIITGIVLGAEFRRETALVILFVGLAKIVESISDAFYGLLQQHERMDRIARSMMIKGLLSLIALSLGVYLTGNLVWGAVGLGMAWLLILLGYDLRSGVLVLKLTQMPESQNGLRGGVYPLWDMQVLGRLVWLALPLGLVMLLISLNDNIPRYFINSYLEERELGIFAAIAYLQRVGITVVNALGQAAAPRLAKCYAVGNGAEFNTLLLKLIGIAVLLGGMGILVALAVGQELLTLLYRPEYAQRDLFVWLMGVASITYVASLLGYGMTAVRYFQAQVPLFAFVTGITSLACMGLTPLYGLRGVALALFIAAVVQVVGSLAVVVHAIKAIHGPI